MTPTIETKQTDAPEELIHYLENAIMKLSNKECNEVLNALKYKDDQI